jgi:uroporphyrinogen decarboxylase
MIARDIIRQNIEYRGEGRIGFNFGGKGRRDDIAVVGCDQKTPTRTWKEGNIEYSTDIWGNVWYRFKDMSQSGEVFKPILEDWAALDNLTLPALDKPEYYAAARQLVETDTEHFRVGFMPGWPFAICRYMRKMEVYLVDLIAERERIDILHDRVTTLLEKIIDGFGAAGLDGIFFCEDLGVQDRTLMSPAMWTDVFRPLYERLTGRAHRYGMKVIQHSCGYNWELVDGLCEAGIDCLQFDQPSVYDMPALAAKLRRHGVGLYAPVDIQKVLPTGDRALIERETERLVNTFRGGLIAKNYGDLPGIGVKPEWDQWAYETFVRVGG